MIADWLKKISQQKDFLCSQRDIFIRPTCVLRSKIKKEFYSRSRRFFVNWLNTPISHLKFNTPISFFIPTSFSLPYSVPNFVTLIRIQRENLTYIIYFNCSHQDNALVAITFQWIIILNELNRFRIFSFLDKLITMS